MKIVFITNLFEPYARGGAEKIVKQLAEEAVQKGDEVTVVTACPIRRGGSRTAPTMHLRVVSFFPLNLYFVGNDFKYSAPIRFFWHIFDTFNIFSYFKIKKILREIKPDLLWTHNLKGIGLLTPLAIRHAGIKHRHTLHDVQLVIPSGLLLYGEEKNWKNNNFFIESYAWITKKLFASPNEIISPSQWLLNFYRKQGFFKDSKCEIHQNPVSVGTDNCPPLRSGGSIKNFLYVGQIEKHKGIFFLVEAWKKLNQGDMKNMQLIVLGDGTQTERLKEEIKEVVGIQFLGKKSEEEVMEYYQKADCLVFPTLCYENSPNVIHEAQSFGLPIIASNLGSISEFVKDGENGFLFEPGDTQSFFQAVEKFFRIQKQ